MKGQPTPWIDGLKDATITLHYNDGTQAVLPCSSVQVRFVPDQVSGVSLGPSGATPYRTVTRLAVLAAEAVISEAEVERLRIMRGDDGNHYYSKEP